MTKLKINWLSWEEKISSLSKEGKTLYNKNDRTNDELQLFSEIYDAWRKNVLKFLSTSLENDEYYIVLFKTANSNRFQITNQQKPIEQVIKELKSDLKNDLEYIAFINKLISISDCIIDSEKVNTSIRATYTSEEILEFILDKLYDLYDNHYYPILPILNGNGINIKRTREEFEYIKTLNDLGYVNSSFISKMADAQLTLEGKIFVEEKRKYSKPNYQSISNSKENIDLKIDELIDKLDKLGLGQEILFNELEELKDLYTKLNKENWGQLIKGKLIDLGLSQVISTDTMKMIYQFVTNDILRIP